MTEEELKAITPRDFWSFHLDLIDIELEREKDEFELEIEVLDFMRKNRRVIDEALKRASTACANPSHEGLESLAEGLSDTKWQLHCFDRSTMGNLVTRMAVVIERQEATIHRLEREIQTGRKL